MESVDGAKGGVARAGAGSAAGPGDLSGFCCQNPGCVDYGKRGAGNLSVCDRSGKHGQYRVLYCRSCKACKARFGGRKGTVFFRSRTPQDKVVSILRHVQEGVGMRKTGRKTGRLVGVKEDREDTVIRYARLAGEHAKGLHDELVAFSPSHP